jgi:hypothetical protein
VHPSFKASVLKSESPRNFTGRFITEDLDCLPFWTSLSSIYKRYNYLPESRTLQGSQRLWVRQLVGHQDQSFRSPFARNDIHAKCAYLWKGKKLLLLYQEAIPGSPRLRIENSSAATVCGGRTGVRSLNRPKTPCKRTTMPPLHLHVLCYYLFRCRIDLRTD